MNAKVRIVFLLPALICMLCAPQAFAASKQGDLMKVDAVQCPSVTLKHWNSSTKEEKLAFLLGFSTMIELEKEWQSTKPLPISKSTVGSWVKGLSGVTLGGMSDTLDKYFAEHPDEAERPVVEVLGHLYVRPAMTEDVRKEAADHYARISGKK